MKPRIETIQEKQFVGKRINTTLASNDTFTLWSSFMPRRKEIKHAADANLYSVEVYPTSLNVGAFTPHTPFEKWAAVAVTQLQEIPEGLEALVIPAGLYAVFLHKGPARTYPQTAQYIFGQWLPQSEYDLDNRPHFEIMPPGYRPDDPEAEEEVWVPVKKKESQ